MAKATREPKLTEPSPATLAALEKRNAELVAGCSDVRKRLQEASLPYWDRLGLQHMIESLEAQLAHPGPRRSPGWHGERLQEIGEQLDRISRRVDGLPLPEMRR